MYVSAVISGRVQLPSRAERNSWLVRCEKQFEERGVDPASRKSHSLDHKQWLYMKNLLRKAGGPGTIMSRTNAAKDCLPWWMDTSPPGQKSTDDSAALPLKYVHEDTAAELTEDELRFVLPNPHSDDDLDSEQQLKDTKLVMKMLAVREIIYDDIVQHWFKFPGEEDAFRRRMYHVNWKSGIIKVFISDIKANGEIPYNAAVIPEESSPVVEA